MANLIRFGVAMESDLLDRFDELVERRGNANRSEAVRDLVRKELTEDAWAEGRKMVATKPANSLSRPGNFRCAKA